jgi:hypothetical protein
VQLLGRNKHSIEKFVRLKVPGLRLVEDLADVVDRPLDGPDPAAGPESSGSRPSCAVLFTTSTMLTASAAAAMYKYNGSPGSGATSIRRDTRCCFNSWKACSASSV